MKHTPPYALAAAAALLSSTAYAVDTNLAPGGYTGYGVTPTARLLGWGQFSFAYDNQLPGAADPSGHNYVAGFGLLPHLEIAGRLAANTLHENCLLTACNGVRDLSASAKVGMALDSANRYHVAAGISDFGGSATQFRSVYGVLTYARDTVEASAGYARRQTSAGSRTPLDGVFASAAWQPLSWVRGHVEYTDGNTWAGVRLFAPSSWLPTGWSAHVGANTRLTSTNATERTWFSAGITIPLYKVPKVRTTPHASAAGAVQSAAAPAGATAPAAGATRGVTDAQLEELARALQARGLEDISVGRTAEGVIAVRANNATYNWNTVDALGAALGATADTLGGERSRYSVVLTQRQIPIVEATGETDCLRQWIAEAAGTCPGVELATPATLPPNALQSGAAWVVRNLQPSWKTVRVQLSPVLRSNLGTELGAFDYSLGLNVGFSQPLWAGATADWRVQGQVARSDDYGPGHLFESRRVLPGTERLALTQTVEFDKAPALSAQGSIGRITHHFDGVFGSVRWEPGLGQHRVTAQGGWMHNSRPGLLPVEPRNATPLLLSYRYYLPRTNSYFEATGGRFMNNDGGAQLGMRQWFGDVAVQVFLRRTKFQDRAARTVAGLEFSVPIGPGRDMQPSGFQVTGTPRFSHTVQTVVHSSGSGSNPVVFGQGLLPPAPSLDAVYNSDRASLLYFRDNLPRLRDAAR